MKWLVAFGSDQNDKLFLKIRTSGDGEWTAKDRATRFDFKDAEQEKAWRGGRIVPACDEKDS